MTFVGPRNAFADPTGLSLADVLRRVAASASLTERQKRELTSAVNSTCLWLHRTPAEVPAAADFLRRAFDRLEVGSLGVGAARIRNVRSLLKAALKAADLPGSSACYLALLDPVWAARRGAISDSYMRQCLGRLMRYCSARGITPDQVNDAVVDAYREALRVEDLTANPEVAAQSAVRLWNRAVDEVPGWPQVRLTPIRRQVRYTLDWAHLPGDLVADVDRFLAIQAGADPTHPLAPPRPLKPHSLRKRRYEIQQLVSGAHLQGMDVSRLRSLADLCRVDLVRSALHFFIDRHRARHGNDADPAESTMIGGIADTIRVIAKHYVAADTAVLAELTRIAGRLNRRQPGMSEKARQRLAQLDTPDVERRLLVHSRAELTKLAATKRPVRQDAVRCSVLLAIELCLRAPMRIENLAALDLDRHFVWPPRRNGDITITIARDEVKNRQPLHYVIGEATAGLLYVFLDRFRPMLVSQPTSALFPGMNGGHKRNDTLSKQITHLLKSELGLAWHVHAFRHLAARIYLRAHPGDFEGARRLLAHTSIETTSRIYDGLEMRSVTERYDQLVESLRGPDPSRSNVVRRRRQPAGGDRR
jgi:integrase